MEEDDWSRTKLRTAYLGFNWPPRRGEQCMRLWACAGLIS